MENYLGNSGQDGNSEQARLLREIIESQQPEENIISDFETFILYQSSLEKDTVSLINKSLMPGDEDKHREIGSDDFPLKASIYKKIIDRFPEEPSFLFHYSDCCQVRNGKWKIEN